MSAIKRSKSKNLYYELENRGKKLTVYDKYRINQLLTQKANLESALVANTNKDGETKTITDRYVEVCDELDTISTLISKYIALLDKAMEFTGLSQSAESLIENREITMSDIKMIVERFTKLAECYNLINAVALSAR
jgi:hypothetical protein